MLMIDVDKVRSMEIMMMFKQMIVDDDDNEKKCNHIHLTISGYPVSPYNMNYKLFTLPT